MGLARTAQSGTDLSSDGSTKLYVRASTYAEGSRDAGGLLPRRFVGSGGKKKPPSFRGRCGRRLKSRSRLGAFEVLRVFQASGSPSARILQMLSLAEDKRAAGAAALRSHPQAKDGLSSRPGIQWSRSHPTTSTGKTMPETNGSRSRAMRRRLRAWLRRATCGSRKP